MGTCLRDNVCLDTISLIGSTSTDTLNYAQLVKVCKGQVCLFEKRIMFINNIDWTVQLFIADTHVPVMFSASFIFNHKNFAN